MPSRGEVSESMAMRESGVVRDEKTLTVAEIAAKTNLAALIGQGRPVKRKTEVAPPTPPPKVDNF